VETVANFFFELRIRIASLFHWDRRDARFIVLLGGPGAGKGTLAARLAPKLGLPHLNMGSILRREIAEGTAIGRKWGPRIKAGELVPDSVIRKLLKRELSQAKYNGGAVLDGIPRTARQARQLRRLLASLANRVEAVIFLDVVKADLLERLALRRTCTKSDCGRTYHLKYMPPKVDNKCDVCGSPLMQRDDEKAESVITRMDEFARTFAPLRRYYERLKLLKVVTSTNAMGPDKVFDEVAFYLEETM
jgi:adenylate kinase